MTTVTFTGLAHLERWQPPATATVTAVTVDGAPALFVQTSNGISISSPAVTPLSSIAITYSAAPLQGPVGPGAGSSPDAWKVDAYKTPMALTEAKYQEDTRRTKYEAALDAFVQSIYAPYVESVGTVTYIDRTAAVNGDGTSHLTPRNTFPTFVAGNSYLFAGGRTHKGTVTFPAGGRTLFGSYDPITGARVVAASRIATLDADGASRGITTHSTLDSQAGVVSGLRIVNARSATTPRGILITKASAAAATAGWVVEHCVITDIGVGASLGMAIESYADDGVYRFNKIDGVDVDGIYIATVANAGGRNSQIYGNDITLRAESTAANIDCLQLYNNGTGGLGAFRIFGNKFRNHANIKQCIIVQDTVSVESTAGIIEDNLCIGADLTLPVLGVGGVGQKGILVDAHNTIVRNNYVSGSAFPIFVEKPGCTVSKNVAALWGLAGSESARYRACVASYANNTTVVDNVCIMDSPLGDSPNIYGIHEHGTTGSIVKGNLILGRGTGLHVSAATTEEDNTIMVTSLPRESAAGGMHTGVAAPLGARSTSDYTPDVAADGKPRGALLAPTTGGISGPVELTDLAPIAPRSVLGNDGSEASIPEVIPFADLPVSGPMESRASSIPQVAVATTTLTLGVEHMGKSVERTAGSPQTTTIALNTNAPIPLERTVWVVRAPGSAAHTLTAPAGVSLQAPPGLVSIGVGGAQNIAFPEAGAVLLMKAGPDTWRVMTTSGFAPVNAIKVGIGAPSGADSAGSYVRKDAPWRGAWFEDGVLVDGSILWSARPAPSAALLGAVITITDPTYGLVREDFQCLQLGASYQWVPAKDEITVVMRDAPAGLTLTTGMQWVHTLTFPQGLIFPGVEAEVLAQWFTSGAAGTKTIVTRLGPSTYVNNSTGIGATAAGAASLLKFVKFADNTTARCMPAGINGYTSGTSSTLQVTDLDLSGANTTIAFGALASVGGDTATLISARVKLIFPRA